mgnify:CR=1 FL=1
MENESTSYSELQLMFIEKGKVHPMYDDTIKALLQTNTVARFDRGGVKFWENDDNQVFLSVQVRV